MLNLQKFPDGNTEGFVCYPRRSYRNKKVDRFQEFPRFSSYPRRPLSSRALT